jgi:hypothetical protein
VTLAVFSGTPTPDDVIPAEMSAAIAQSERPEFTSADIRAARRVLSDDPGWLLPATNGEICLERTVYPLLTESKGVVPPPTRSQSCATEAEVRAGRLVEAQALLTSGTQAKSSRVVGVVPNGVTTVTIVLRRRPHVSVEVIHNAYEAIVPDPIKVQFVTRRGSQLEEHVIPLITFSTRSAAPTHD